MDLVWCELFGLVAKSPADELIVRDSETSRLDNIDLLGNDNFSVVNSRRLLGEFAVVCVCSENLELELRSDKLCIEVGSASVATTRPERLSNVVVLKSGISRTRKFSLHNIELGN